MSCPNALRGRSSWKKRVCVDQLHAVSMVTVTTRRMVLAHEHFTRQGRWPGLEGFRRAANKLLPFADGFADLAVSLLRWSIDQRHIQDFAATRVPRQLATQHDLRQVEAMMEVRRNRKRSSFFDNGVGRRVRLATNVEHSTACCCCSRRCCWRCRRCCCWRSWW
jgi:hypothetical protein